MGQFQSTQVCTTPACINTASNVLLNLAPHWKQLDPCTSFEEMVCYGYKERWDEGFNAAMYELGPQNQRIIKQILEGNFSAATQHRSATLGKRANTDEFNFNMLKQTYDACMDTEALAKKGVEPIIQLLKDISRDSGWPYITDFSKKPDAADLDAVANTAVALGKLGASPWQVDAASYPQDPTVFMPVLQGFESTLDAPSDYEDEKKLHELIVKFNATFSSIYPAKLDANTTLQLARGVASFEAEIAKAYAEPVAELQKKVQAGVASLVGTRMDAGFTKTPFSELATIAPELRLDKIMLGILPSGYKGEDVLLSFASVLPNIAKIFKNQPVPVLQAWLVHVAINTFKADVVSPEKQSELTDRWETCFGKLNEQVGYLVDRFFVQHTYTEQGRAASFKMTARIKAEFKKRLGTYSWMGEEAKKRAIKKVDNMIEQMGWQSENPDVMSPDSLTAWYSNLNVTDDHFSNVLSAKRHSFSLKQSKLIKGANRAEWPKRTAETNAFYSPSTNGIYIHAGISRAPYFHADLPQYALYGGLGAILGHEITHGFDIEGSQYDENARKQQWWDNATMAAYQEKAQCFVDQYNKFEFKGPNAEKKHADGQKTLGENQSDAAGLSISYAAWQEERKAMPDVWDQSLPGLEEFTHEQLFFIIWGNQWCSNFTPEKKLELLLTDSHALNEHRILGALSNSKGFKEAFKCQKKEPECELW
ncbi:hypothetical protein QBC43DRAFT_216673 [Cladorrhinum sp. PSN259]|nr:hypothetical protein QBC43DRAFT_216673 [Cladorrhinum sp. PSN259]